MKEKIWERIIILILQVKAPVGISPTTLGLNITIGRLAPITTN